jgi:hypothetical protein
MKVYELSISLNLSEVIVIVIVIRNLESGICVNIWHWLSVRVIDNRK